VVCHILTDGPATMHSKTPRAYTRRIRHLLQWLYRSSEISKFNRWSVNFNIVGVDRI